MLVQSKLNSLASFHPIGYGSHKKLKSVQYALHYSSWSQFTCDLTAALQARMCERMLELSFLPLLAMIFPFKL